MMKNSLAKWRNLVKNKAFSHYFLPLITIFILLSVGFFISGSLFDGLGNNRKQTILRVGVSPDYPPFEFVKDGEIVGFEVDLIKEVAKRLGMDLELHPMDFDNIIASLNSGAVDVGVSGFTQTPERMEAVDFSKIYYENQLAIISKKSFPLSADHLVGAIGAQMGSTMETYLHDQINSGRIHGIWTLSLPNNNQLIRALEIGHINGVIMEEVQAIEFLKRNKALTYKSIDNSGQGISMIFSKGSYLVQGVDQILRDMENDGAIEMLKKKWIDSSISETPLTPSLWEMFLLIVPGVQYSIIITIVAALFGSLLGMILVEMRYSSIKCLQYPVKLYVSLFRGTPILIQLFIVYYGIPGTIGWAMSPFLAIFITFSLNSAAYVTEIIRSGIKSVSRGQMEAAQALGLSYKTSMRRVIMPQAIRSSLPALVNEVISLLKETSIISIMGIPDLLFRARGISAQYYTLFAPYLMVALCYYILVVVLSIFAEKLEKKLGSHGKL